MLTLEICFLKLSNAHWQLPLTQHYSTHLASMAPTIVLTRILSLLDTEDTSMECKINIHHRQQ